jgi:hypothetical protein
VRRGKLYSADLEHEKKEMAMYENIRSSVMAAICGAVAATAFAGDAAAGPINMVSSSVIKTPSATEQIYYRRYYGGYYRRGYAYGPRYYYGRPAYYGYGYGYGYPVVPVPVPLPLPFFGW